MSPQHPAADRLPEAEDAGLEAAPERYRPAGAAVRHAAVGCELPAQQEARRGARPAELEEAAAGGQDRRGEPQGGVGQQDRQDHDRGPGGRRQQAASSPEGRCSRCWV